ncbi:MAG: DLW-39 family protein [Streptosporangiaceae bacterium]
MLVLVLLGLGVLAVWRKVQADRAEIDLWTEATTAELN